MEEGLKSGRNLLNLMYEICISLQELPYINSQCGFRLYVIQTLSLQNLEIGKPNSMMLTIN